MGDLLEPRYHFIQNALNVANLDVWLSGLDAGLDQGAAPSQAFRPAR
jgi:hypothetical protein